MQSKDPDLKNLVESLLFVVDRPISLRRLSQVLEVKPSVVEAVLERLAQDCYDRGVRLVRKGESVQMVTCPEAAPYVERLLNMDGTSKLSAAALEVLAIVVYEQPISRARIEAIRGVACDSVLTTLITRGLVEAVERQDTAGRPFLYGTTMRFLQHFGLPNLEAFPPLEKPLPAVGEGGEQPASGGATPTPRFSFS